ncbi:GreA/GreB family elongation factor [Ammoniphilus sp. YIM 78166]|uniref:GreA/GreB family elongation factor n=1 Tax=Ammoniphilus sp. YIM 78166 TaxID=1644106 RepID=UPI001F0EDD64|nr:GreA/GreB family elongation factor [Ammoniphilus sp. YIM 78166]
MMNHSYNHPLRSGLVKQLVFIDENRTELLNQYLSSAPTRDRNLKFFEQYVSEIEHLISSLGNQASACLNKVYIGTEVSVLYEDDQFTDQFTICFPEQSNPEQGCISFLSPVGNQLLLRELGERVVLCTPTGETSVVIQNIQYNEGMVW